MAPLPINRIERGDSLAVMRTWPDRCVQLVLTSPPYWGLRDYQGDGESLAGQWGREPTPEAHVARLVEWAREVRRILRDDGVLVLNYGDAYASSSSYNAPRTMHTEAGWKQAGRGPNPGAVPGHKPKDMLDLPGEIARALRADGWYFRGWCPWVKLNGMPESTRDRPALSVERMLMFTKRPRYYWDQEAIRVGYAEASIARADGSRVTARGAGNVGFERTLSKLYQPRTGPEHYGRSVSRMGSEGNVRRHVRGEPQERHYHQHGRIRKTGDWWRESVALAAAQARAWADHAEAVLAREDGLGMLLDFEGMPLGQLHGTYAYPGSHFATFPPALVRPWIRAATSERGECPACGAPWVREVEREKENPRPVGVAGKTAEVLTRQESERPFPWARTGEQFTWKTTTTGWRPSCACEAGEPVPQIVCDPFAGTGTTLVVAAEEGRRTVGVDLYGGEYDFGGHTAHDRLRAATGEGPPIEAAQAEREGQLNLLGES